MKQTSKVIVIAAVVAAIALIYSVAVRAQSQPRPVAYTVLLPDGSTVLAGGVVHPVGSRQIVLTPPPPHVFYGGFEP